ncbi:hypothetical protein M8J76_007974 [Diaphorina citri]|nr:hypothetical protein M8J75_016212 [Diaphorina citri]KAI5726760.1 hypothetical protein M8J76_007974 [Diaphorina citri]KAI5731635.1 hypothetical protein M8J77_013586 [Diaphorina citri]
MSSSSRSSSSSSSVGSESRIILRDVHGTVKSYLHDMGVGKLLCDKIKNQIFVHRNEMTYIPTGFFVYDPIGDRVVFDILQTPQGLRAVNVQLLIQYDFLQMPDGSHERQTNSSIHRKALMENKENIDPSPKPSSVRMDKASNGAAIKMKKCKPVSFVKERDQPGLILYTMDGKPLYLTDEMQPSTSTGITHPRNPIKPLPIKGQRILKGSLSLSQMKPLKIHDSDEKYNRPNTSPTIYDSDEKYNRHNTSPTIYDSDEKYNRHNTSPTHSKTPRFSQLSVLLEQQKSQINEKKYGEIEHGIGDADKIIDTELWNQLMKKCEIKDEEVESKVYEKTLEEKEGDILCDLLYQCAIDFSDKKSDVK